MTFVLMRHAEKLYDNRESPNPEIYPPFDPPIIHPEQEKIYRTFQKIILEGVRVKKIVCSPFLRTRQTAEIANDFFNKPIEIEPNIGEFINGDIHNIQDPVKAFTKETWEFNPFYNEKKRAHFPPEQHFCQDFFEKRVLNYWQNNDHAGNFYVTHGFVIFTILEFYGFKKYPKEFSGAIMVFSKRKQNYVPLMF